MNGKLLLRKLCAVSLAAVMAAGTAVTAAVLIPDMDSGFKASAYSGSVYIYGDFEYMLKTDDDGNKCVMIISYNGSDKNVILPESINDMKVICIDTGVFSHKDWIETVKIPESVTVIEDSAFAECIGLKEITLPKNLTEVGQFAFAGCIGLKQLTLPASLNFTGIYAFENCSSLESVTLYTHQLNVGAFLGCTGLKKIVIPEGTEGISSRCFSGCKGLEEVVLPKSLKYIGQSAFENCTALKGLELSDNVVSIGSLAFSGCVKLEDIHLPESLEGIQESCFNGCVNLKSMDVPDSVRFIGYHAFADCTALEKVAWGSAPQIQMIYTGAFLNCTNLKNVVIPEGVKEIYDSAFQGCNCLKKVVLPESLDTLGACAFAECLSLEEVIIKEGLTEIPNCAFTDCPNLISATIPDSITKMDYFTFDSAMGGMPKDLTIFGTKGSTAEEYAKMKEIKFAAKGTLINKSTVSSKDIALGMTVTLNAKAIGGNGDYTYALLYKKSSSSTWTKIGKKYGTQSVGSFTPKTATTYDVMINVKDSTGKVKSKTFQVKVDKNLRNISTVTKSVAIGEKVRMNAAAAGGEGPYTYKMLYKKHEGSKWTVIGNGYSSVDTGSFRPKTATLYDVKINVKDSTGTVKSKTFTVDAYFEFVPIDDDHLMVN